MSAYSAPTNLADLREYVLGPDTGIQARGANTVLLHVIHAQLNRFFPELRLDKHMTIAVLKEKLYTHTGTNPTSMKLSLKDCNSGEVKASFSEADSQRKLGYFDPQDSDILHIVDLDPGSLVATGSLENTSLVEKYEMSEEDYSKRKGTVREWKQKVMATQMQQQQEGHSERTTSEIPAEVPPNMKEGDRCEVFPGGRRGWVRFVGAAASLGPGFWVGVEYDEPVGKHDGQIKGHRYFQCQPNFGAIVRPDKVTVGDFPTLDEELGLES